MLWLKHISSLLALDGNFLFYCWNYFVNIKFNILKACFFPLQIVDPNIFITVSVDSPIRGLIQHRHQGGLAIKMIFFFFFSQFNFFPETTSYWPRTFFSTWQSFWVAQQKRRLSSTTNVKFDEFLYRLIPLQVNFFVTNPEHIEERGKRYNGSLPMFLIPP